MFPVVFSTTLIEQSRVLSSATVQTILIIAGLTNLADLTLAEQCKTTARLGRETGMRSLRLVEKLLEEVMRALLSLFGVLLGT